MLIPERKLITIHTSLLFDPQTKSFLSDISLAVDPESGLISSVTKRSGDDTPLPDEITAPDIDLRGKTVLPGLVDAHTHIFLHAYAETPSINQERDESFVERVLRASNHCRDALMAGYTTYRDLGTEGAFDADAHVRNAVNRGLIPGPRLFVATEALTSSNSYAIRQENELGGVTVPRLADPCDGVEGVRAAVRRRLGAGADIIKFYADYRKRGLRFPGPWGPGCCHMPHVPQGLAKNYLLFNQDEMNEIVREAKTSEAPVAAHAGSTNAVIMAARAGVTTIEHGNELEDEALEAMRDAGTIWVPTLAVFELYRPRGGSFEIMLDNVWKAWKMGIPVGAGGDTGAFPHGDNARELELLLEAQLPLEEVLVAATLRGWEACGGEWCGRKFGLLKEGWAADVVALEGDLREDASALRKVEFVMRDGKVFKMEGKSMMG